MSSFRFRTSAPWSPEPGDILENTHTGNRWRVLSVRSVNARKLDPECPFVYRIEQERVSVTTLPPEDGRLWPFVAD